MKFALVAAVDKNFGLGKNNTLPWRLPADLKHFSRVTTDVKEQGRVNAVIMGRKTWESLPAKSRPLQGRVNVVLSRNEMSLPSDAILASSLEDAFTKLAEIGNLENVFVIGGGRVFEDVIVHTDCYKVYLTQIDGVFDCDAFFPGEILKRNFNLKEEGEMMEENGLKFKFCEYSR